MYSCDLWQGVDQKGSQNNMGSQGLKCPVILTSPRYCTVGLTAELCFVAPWSDDHFEDFINFMYFDLFRVSIFRQFRSRKFFNFGHRSNQMIVSLIIFSCNWTTGPVHVCAKVF